MSLEPPASDPASTAPPVYWCDRQLIVAVDGPEGYVETVLEQPFARVGSHERSDIVLKHGTVALRHIYLHATDAGVYCVHLSTDDASRDCDDRWLAPDEEIRIGPCRLSARLLSTCREDEPDCRGRGGPSDAAGPFPLLAASVDAQSLGEIRIRRPLTVLGRSRPSRIRASSHSLSRCHCALYWDGRHLWVVDLLSSGGTWIDGQSTAVGRLSPGGTLGAGRVQWVWKTEASGGQPQTVREARDAFAGRDLSGAEDANDSAPTPHVELASGREGLIPGVGEPADLEETLETDRLALEAALTELSRRQEQFEAEEKQRRAEAARQEAEIARRAAALETNHRELAACREEVERSRHRWQEEREDEEKELARQRAELDSQRRQFAADRQAREQKLAMAAAEQCHGHEKRVADLTSQEEALEQRRDELRAVEERLAGDRRQWAEQRQEAEHRLAVETKRLSEDTQRLAAEREALDRCRAQWQNQREQREQELAAREEEVAARLVDLETRRQALDAERQSQDHRRAELEFRSEAKRAELDGQRTEVAKLREELEVRQQTLGRNEEAMNRRQEEWLAERKAQREELARQAQSLSYQWAEFESRRQQAESESRERGSFEEEPVEAASVTEATQRRKAHESSAGDRCEGTPGDRPSNSFPTEGGLDEREGDELFGRMTNRLISFRQSETRWARLRRAIGRGLRLSRNRADPED